MSDPALPAVLREIDARGPIPFADFMRIALADPDSGYYTRARERPTRHGDFLTAPELHPIFAAAVGRQLDETWRQLGEPEAFTLVEHGAGAGTLALGVLAGLRADRSGLAAALRYAPSELNPHRRRELAARCAAAGLPLVEAVPGLTGALLANEFLDALPVHIVEVHDGRLAEVHVTASGMGAAAETAGAPAGGSLAEVLLPPSTPDLPERVAALAAAGIVLAEGQRAEFCLETRTWAAAAATDRSRAG